MKFSERLQHAWNAFKDAKRPPEFSPFSGGYTMRPDRATRRAPDKSIITSVYTRISVDVAAINIQHIRIDANGRFKEVITSGLNSCLNLGANIDQTGPAMIQELVMTLCEDGVAAVVPVDTDVDPEITASYEIESVRVGEIVEWYPDKVKVRLYNDRIGNRQDVVLPKSMVAIIENPFYAVMNEPNSTLKRLTHKLNLLDAVDEQSSSGKLDLIIQLPYTVKTEMQQKRADARLKSIEMQLSGSKYGIAYADSTEHITQLNRPVENNLLNQVTYLTTLLYNQLGLSEAVFNGTANESEMLNYQNKTLKPFLEAICLELKRKFLTKTARTQGQSIAYFFDPFRLVPVSQLAEISDKLTRNAILSSNEIRAIVGYKPVDDPRADELSNKNLNQDSDDRRPPPSTAAAEEGERTER